jgi:hypothetical protein
LDNFFAGLRHALRVFQNNPGFTLALVGVALGVGAAFGLTRLIASFPFRG